jgi:hypothetical protein
MHLFLAACTVKRDFAARRNEIAQVSSAISAPSSL